MKPPVFRQRGWYAGRAEDVSEPLRTTGEFAMPIQRPGQALILGAFVLVAASVACAADAPPPGNVQLLAGYVHEPLQGIDSIVGKISKKGGLTIQYEIGRVPKPGGLALGGDFSNAAQRLPEKDRRWLKQQVVAGEPVDIAYGKNDVLIVSFPKSGVNFTSTVKTQEELADVLLMVLTYPGEKKPAAK
jgi:hypothetical protein